MLIMFIKDRFAPCHPTLFSRFIFKGGMNEVNEKHAVNDLSEILGYINCFREGQLCESSFIYI